MTKSTSRTWGVQLGPVSGVVLAVLVPAAVCLAMSAVLWWVVAVVVAAISVMLVVSYKGFTVAQYGAGWFRHRRRRQLAALPEPVEVEVAAGTAAMVWTGEDAVVALIELAPTLSLPTLARDSGIYTEDRVPLATLASLSGQYGLDLDLKVVQVGRRVPALTTGSLYAHAAGALNLVAQRNTVVIVRLDLSKSANLVMTGARGPVAVHAPKALATAVHRIAIRCREEGVRAQVVATTEQFRRVTALLAADIESMHWKQGWSRLHAHHGDDGPIATTARAYWVKGDHLSTEAVDRIWAHPAVTTMTSLNVSSVLAGTADGVGLAGSVAYLDGPQPVHADVDVALQSASGQQLDTFDSVLPHHQPRTQPPITVITRSELDAQLALPVGPSGQILGVARSGATMAMSLHDPAVIDPRPMRVEVAANHFIIRQLALRALGCGLQVAVYTTTRDLARWSGLINQFGHLGFVASTDPSTAVLTDQQLVVVDRGVHGLESEQLAHRSVVTLNEVGEPLPSADLMITQPDPRVPAVDVAIPALGTISLQLLLTRHEDRYIGTFTADEEPILARTGGTARPHPAPGGGARHGRAATTPAPPVSALAQAPAGEASTPAPPAANGRPVATPVNRALSPTAPGQQPPPPPAETQIPGRHAAVPGASERPETSGNRAGATAPDSTADAQLTRAQAVQRMKQAREKARRRVEGDN